MLKSMRGRMGAPTANAAKDSEEKTDCRRGSGIDVAQPEEPQTVAAETL